MDHDAKARLRRFHPARPARRDQRVQFACQSETITFYGYLMSDGSVWCNPPIIGPYHGPTIVGQITYACDGHTYSWGNTSCSVHPPTYEYDDCGCEYGRMDGAENDDVREGAPADETARACAE